MIPHRPKPHTLRSEPHTPPYAKLTFSGKFHIPQLEDAAHHAPPREVTPSRARAARRDAPLRPPRPAPGERLQTCSASRGTYRCRRPRPPVAETCPRRRAPSAPHHAESSSPPARRIARQARGGERERGSRRTGEKKRSRPISVRLTGADSSQWMLPPPRPLQPPSCVMLLCLTAPHLSDPMASGTNTKPRPAECRGGPGRTTE